jgi:MFS family permease
MVTPKTVDVDTFIDGLKLSRFHFFIIGLCTLLMMIDGYELYVVGYVLPVLAEDFGATRTDLTPILVAQQIGMVAGAYFITPLADRLGRPRVLFAAFAVISITCLGILFSPSIQTFIVLRFFAGMFASAVVPILLSIVSENAPKRLRATFGTILISGSLGGALIGAFMQAVLLEPYGWRSAFWLGAIMPVLLLPVIWFVLPESLRFLLAKRPNDARIPAIVRRMQQREDEEIVVVPAAPKDPITQQSAPAKGLLSGLFGEGRTFRTLLLWFAFMSSFTYISAGNWKTTIFRDVVGLDWQQVALATALGTGFGIVGNIGIGMAIDRWGFRRVLPAAFFLAAVSIIIMGALTPYVTLFFVFLVIMNIFQHGGQAGLAALASGLYPSHQRATGVGWAYGAGRIASIFAPLLGAFALTLDLPPVGLFALFAIPLTSAGLFVALLFTVTREPQGARVAAHA